MTMKDKISSASRHASVLNAVLTGISRYVRLPLPPEKAARAAGVSEKDLLATLKALRRKGRLDGELDRRVSLQKLLDEELCRPAHLVGAPLLDAEEIRAGEFLPRKGRRDRRPFVTLAVPREYAGSVVRFCAFLVDDNVMAPLHIFKGDAVVCAIGLPPRDGAPVLCVLPEDGHVCVRCFFRNQTMLRELADPERKQVSFAAFDPDRVGVVGPIISVQRFIRSWRRYGGPETPEAEA